MTKHLTYDNRLTIEEFLRLVFSSLRRTYPGA